MQIPKNKSIRTVICISFVTVFLLSFSFMDFNAFAVDTNQEYQPPQPNAFASYNNATNQVQVSWNFTTGGVNAPETCLLKGDFVWYEDLKDDHTTGVRDVDYTKITGFIPTYYSVVSSNPTVIDTLSEVVPCEGSTRIDLDTIMNHSENINNYSDLEIFLTFYVPDTDGSLNVGNAFRIDEVFVMYAPDSVFDEADYKDYGCNGQIGSTLYVDGSGSGNKPIAYGDNGDNCGDHLYLENNEYVDIGMDGTPTEGVATYDFHDDSSFSLRVVVHYPYESEYRGSSCADCVPPTFGLDDNNFLIVTDGFSYNGNVTDVTNYHTDFPLITTVTNKTNIVLVKVYENNGINNIKLVQFGLGMPEVGSALEHAQTLIEIWLEKGQVVKIIEIDKNNLVTLAAVETSEVECGGTDQKCLAIKLQYFYKDQPKYNIMAINAIDFKRNSQTNYLNEGIEVIGESLNEPLTQKVTVSQSGAFYPQKSGSTILTLSDYKTDTWIDEYGYIWSTNEYGPYLVDMISPPEQTPDVISPWSGYNDRLHSEFGKYVKMQQEKAAIILDTIQ